MVSTLHPRRAACEKSDLPERREVGQFTDELTSIAIPPQPVPISRSLSPARTRALVRILWIFRRWADSRSSGAGPTSRSPRTPFSSSPHMAQEYIISLLKKH